MISHIIDILITFIFLFSIYLLTVEYNKDLPKFKPKKESTEHVIIRSAQASQVTEVRRLYYDYDNV